MMPSNILDKPATAFVRYCHPAACIHGIDPLDQVAHVTVQFQALIILPPKLQSHDKNGTDVEQSGISILCRKPSYHQTCLKACHKITVLDSQLNSRLFQCCNPWHYSFSVCIHGFWNLLPSALFLTVDLSS